MLSVRTLGELTFARDGKPITAFSSHKAKALLVYLAVERSTAHRRERLFTLLWPGMPEKSGRNNLRQVLFALRQAIPEVNSIDGNEPAPLILADYHTVQLNPAATVAVDVQRIDKLLGEINAHDHVCLTSCAACQQWMEQAVELYTGSFLRDFYLEDSNQFEEWSTAARETYQSKVLETLETLTEITYQNKDYEQAQIYAERQLAVEPIKESAHRQLMKILVHSGHRAAALRQYRACQQILSAELGVAPSTDTIILHENIRTESFPSPEREEAHSSKLPAPRHNLPHSLTSFIGRQLEIETICELIDHHRLVTLTGAGGIGKTKLSIQVGHHLLDAFPAGVWFIEFAPIADPDLVPQTVAYVLGLFEPAGRSVIDFLIDYLRDKHCVLILDNCEHLIDAVANLAKSILHTCPGVKIMTTSREALAVAGEHIFLVPALSFPESETAVDLEDWGAYDALCLFAKRADAVLPDFQVTQNNLNPLLQICQQLDGIPLAIELAAARVGMLTLGQIANRLKDGYQLLTQRDPTTHARHQTLHASIEWSWDLLSSAEQLLLARLSVFSGGMNLQAVEAVCTGDGIGDIEILDLITQLVVKSLVVAERIQGEETRYRMLDTIRQFSWRRLAEADKIQERHLEYYKQFALQAEQELMGPDQVVWYSCLEREMDNIRSALNWAFETNVQSGLHLITSIWRFLYFGYEVEGEAWVSKLLSQTASIEPAIKAKALWVLSRLTFSSTLNTNLSNDLLHKSLKLYRELGDQHGIACCLFDLGASQEQKCNNMEDYLIESLKIFQEIEDKLWVAEGLRVLSFRDAKQYDESHKMDYRYESEKLFREIGHLAGIAQILRSTGVNAMFHGELESARSNLNESLSIQELFGVKRSSWLLTSLGEVYYWMNDYEKAFTYLKRSLRIIQQTGNKMQRLWTLVKLGYIHVKSKEFSQARSIFIKCQHQFSESNELSGLIFATEGLALLEASQSNFVKAIQLFAWADTARLEIGDNRPPVEQAAVEQETTALIDRIGEEAYELAYTEGESMTMEQVLSCSKAVFHQPGH